MDKYGKWISVKDRLPDVDTEKSYYKRKLVITYNGAYVNVLYYTRDCIRGKKVYRWEDFSGRIYRGNPISHWMPLPEPPGEE